MKVPVRDLHQGGGVNLDQQPNSLPMTTFSNVVNGRFTRARLEKIGGSVLLQEVASNPQLDDARALFEFAQSGTEGLLLITKNKIYIDIGVGWQDVTPTPAPSDAADWTMDQYGDVILVTSLLNRPYVLMPGGSTFVTLTNWPSTYKAGRIFFYKNFAVAVNIEILSNTQNGFVAWSDVIIDGDVQNAEWTPAPTNLAGTNILPDGTGAILEGGVLRDSGILYTDRSVWRMDLASISAGTDLVFNFRRIFSDDGIYNIRCWTEVQGQHFVVGLNHIYMHDGFNRVLIADNRVNEFFYSRIGTERFAFVTHYHRSQEIIISLAWQDFVEANETLVFNYVYNSWTRWVFSEFTGCYSYLCIGPEFIAGVPSYDDWISEGITYLDLMATSYDDLFPDAKRRQPYILSRVNEKIYLLDQDTSQDIFPVDFIAEKIDFDFDEVFNTEDTIKHIRRIIPLASGVGQFRFQVGGRNSLGVPVVWGNEQFYNLSTDYKLDFRVSYRYPAIRFRQTSSDGLLSLTGYDVDVISVSGH